MTYVVHVAGSTRLEQGGPSISVTSLADHLAQVGVPIAMVCPDHSNDSRTHVQSSVPVYGSLQECWEREVRGAQGCVHLHGVWDWHLHRDVQWCRRHGVPYVFSPHGMLEPWALQAKRWKKRLAWWLYQRRDLQGARFLLATAPSEAEQFKRIGLRSPVVMYPNGVRIPESLAVMAEGRERKRALFLSRVHPKKGLLMLAQAWRELRPEGWEMMVVGPDVGGHRAQVESLVEQLGIRRDWTFVDSLYKDKKEQVFLESDLFVLPTYSENFGIAVAEALAYGLPVVTTRGAPWSGLHDRRCGWWVEPALDGVRRGLEAGIQASVEQRRAMGVRGREWMRESFSWQGIAIGLKGEYQKYGCDFHEFRSERTEGGMGL